MTSEDKIIPMNEESVAETEILNQILREVPQEELEYLASMNRKERRQWFRDATKKRGKGYTK